MKPRANTRSKKVETPGKPLDWRVEKMRLSKDKTQIKYNDFLTLDGIPAKAFDYKLGNRSALEWVIDQYRVKTDKRSGIVNDPNRDDDPQYIVKLIGKVITVSLETTEIVERLTQFVVTSSLNNHTPGRCGFQPHRFHSTPVDKDSTLRSSFESRLSRCIGDLSGRGDMRNMRLIGSSYFGNWTYEHPPGIYSGF